MYGKKEIPAKFLTGNFQKHAVKHVLSRLYHCIAFHLASLFNP